MMKRLIVLLLSGLLIACGSAPSERQWAQNVYDRDKSTLESINNLQYGKTMEAVHAQVELEFIPIFDYKNHGHRYEVEIFYIKGSYNLGEDMFVAMYTDGKLTAVTPGSNVKSDWPFKKITGYNGCMECLEDQHLQSVISKIEINKIKLGRENLAKSKEEIEKRIAKLPDEEEKKFTNSDAVELAVMSPFIVLFGPAAIAGAVVTAPLTVPATIISEKQSDERTANTPSRMKEIRKIPLGISIEEIQARSENIELARTPKFRFGNETPVAGYILKNPNMNYDVVFYEKDGRTYLRTYSRK